jgi:hypothetical protein
VVLAVVVPVVPVAVPVELKQEIRAQETPVAHPTHQQLAVEIETGIH